MQIEHLNQTRENTQKELNDLLNEKKKIENIQSDKRSLKEEIQKIEKEINKLEIKEIKINNLTDLHKIECEEMFKEKCMQYIENLVYIWSGNDGRTVVLSKETKEFFNLIREKEFYKEMKKIYYRRMDKYFNDFLIINLWFEEDEKEIYVNYSSKEKKNLENNILSFYEKNKEISNFLFEIIKKNLRNKISDMIKIRDINYKTIFQQNNFLLQKTKFYISNHDEFLEAVLLASIKIESLASRESIIICKEKKDCNLSEDYLTFIFIIDQLDYFKHKNIIKTALINFFEIKKIQRGLFNYFCIFSEITLCIKKYKIEELIKIKEDLFIEIIKNSGINDLDFNQNITNIKFDIQEIILAFNEILNFFIFDTMKNIFIASFFDSLLEKIFNFIIEKKDIPIQDSENFSELINYTYELFDDIKSLNNYCKLKCVDTILNANLSEIENYINLKIICLDKKEMIKLIIALFNDTEKRRAVISKIN
ncbi:hypothetical protein COBT_002065 [Conglomerata obtusa]